MKQKLSITIEEENVALIEEILKKGIFRNKSHILEYALIKFLKGEKNE
jgi:Arc/MetJ-type ribon-helix-helix transcriptional regulator